MSLRNVASSLAFCWARAPTKVSIAPASATATYSSHRQRSLRLRTALPIDAVILELLAARDKSLQGDVPPRAAYPIPIGATLQAILLYTCGRESGALFPSPRPPFAGKSPVLAESLVRPLSCIPILAVGLGTRPSGGHHGGTANNPAEPDVDCRRTPPCPRIPDSFLESGRGRSSDRECRGYFGGTPSGNAACAGSSPAAWSASLRVRSCRVFVGSSAILGIILAANPDSGRGA